MKLIKKIDLDTSVLSASSNSRTLRIISDSGAVFRTQIKRSNGDYYNFTTNLFTATTTTETTDTNRQATTDSDLIKSKKQIQKQQTQKQVAQDLLKTTPIYAVPSALQITSGEDYETTAEQFDSGTYSTTILFPAAASGDTYTIYIHANPHFESEFNRSISRNKYLYSTTITQVADSTITFKPHTDTTGVFADLDVSLGSSTGSSVTRQVGGTRDLVQISTNIDTDTHSSNAGIYYLSDTDLLTTSNTQPYDEDFYWETTETVDGTTSSSTSVVVDDTSYLVIGMELTFKASASDAGGLAAAATNTKITAINLDTKTLTLSVANSLTDGFTMTFRAYGAKYIRDAIGIGLEFKNFKSNLEQTTTTCASDTAANVTMNVNGTRGISKGAYVRGISADNYYDGSAVMSITTVSQSTVEGTITQAQTFAQTSQGEKIYIDGSSHTAKIEGDVHIDRYPAGDQTIFIDVDNIWVTGTAS